ncbi:MAG: glucosamine-6-phosphate deaminase [Phycisphaerae bacterium]|nr:glucosamine-6-phosphate deaminase [Phycisphaerae bacterium]
MEKLKFKIFEDNDKASVAVAARIASIINANNARKAPTVLGLSPGHATVNIYRELIGLHKAENLDFSLVKTFNCNEFCPITADAPQSFYRWMQENFLNHINIDPANIFAPAGDIPEADLAQHCSNYEKTIADSGGIDFLILGIGTGGHIGFNEPGSSPHTLTRAVYLDKTIINGAAGDFFGAEYVPAMGITMGLKTIANAREIALLAFGENKASIIRRTVEDAISNANPASFLQMHKNTCLWLDDASAGALTTIATPWLNNRSIQWDDNIKRRAVIWLAKKLNKPILKLTDEDYTQNGLYDLIKTCSGSYNLNIEIFKRQMNTITGWPGGKNCSKKVLIFSPHPDDDVISMGGTLTRLASQGHAVHIAYMVSGCLSVFDHTLAHYADFVREFNKIFDLTPDQSTKIEQHIDEFLLSKQPGEVDTAQIQALKGMVRRIEAIDAARYCGVPESNTHFLDLPFYNTGKVQKHNVGKADTDIICQLLDEIQPDMIFAAGDLSDPHGTHRQCLLALYNALELKYKNDHPTLFLYRGAWQEWPAAQIDMAVPLSPDELQHKRYAIFKHESQKDRAMFPGSDAREFWQRAEDRNKALADLYDKLGLPEYHAIEAFKLQAD